MSNSIRNEDMNCFIIYPQFEKLVCNYTFTIKQINFKQE